MGLKADTKYAGSVSSGSTFIETQTGTPAFQVNLTCDDGDTLFMIWLTEKNREKAMKYFDILGADKSKLGDPNYLEYELGMAIDGKEVSFGTKEEEYKGKKSIKVAWIGKKSEGKPAQAAAKFFKGETVGQVPPEEDDIPF
jgi:hypothetical protein